MKKLIVLFALLHILLLSADGQNAIEVRFSPTWTYFRASSSYLSEGSLNNLYIMESPTLQLSGDVQLRHLIKEKWLLKSGLGVQAFGYEFDHVSENDLKERLVYRYLTASLLGGYHFKKKKWSGEIVIGFKPAYQLTATKRQKFVDIDNSKITNIESIKSNRTFNVLAVSEIQFNYAITQKIDITIGTSANLMLRPIQESPFYQKQYFSYPFNIGGIYYW